MAKHPFGMAWGVLYLPLGAIILSLLRMISDGVVWMYRFIHDSTFFHIVEVLS